MSDKYTALNPSTAMYAMIFFLHVYYTLLSTPDYRFLLSYLQLWWSYAILSVTPTTQEFFTFHHNFNL